MTHKKTHKIPYNNLDSPQQYLVSDLFSNEMKSLLFNLRCRTVHSFKDNFHLFHQGKINCDLCGEEVDQQEHALVCKSIRKFIHISNSVEYNHIFGNIEEQKKFTILYAKVLKVREMFLNGDSPANRGSENSGPSVL